MTFRLLFSAALFLLPAAAFAQSSAEAKLRDALRGATGQLRALEDENAKSQAREAELKAEKEKLLAELQAERKEAAAAARQRSKSANDVALRQKLAASAAEAAKTSEALASCKRDAADAEAQASKVREDDRFRTAASQARADKCEESRQRLYGIAKEALQRMGDGGYCEPLFGFKRAARENLAQDYRDKLLEEMTARAPAPSPPAAR